MACAACRRRSGGAGVSCAANQNQLNKLSFNENIVFSNQGIPQYEDDFRVGDHEVDLTRKAFIYLIRNNIDRCNRIGENTYNPKATALCMRELTNAIPEWARAADDKTITDKAWGNAVYSVMESRHRMFTDWVKYARYEQSKG